MKRVRTLAMAVALAAFSDACSILHTPPDGAQRNRLWRRIHDDCMPQAAKGAYPPLPCAEVDTRTGAAYAVLKDRTGRFQYLALPLARVSGIESPALLATDSPNYFADAWNARLYVEAALHRRLPRSALVLIVNSAYGRSQDQLHIHVGCIKPGVRDALQRLLPTLDERWRSLTLPLPPHSREYWARWAPGESLSLDPFKSLASALPEGDPMGRHSLVVAGAVSADAQPGFVLLSAHVDPESGDRGNSDELQDLDCTVADVPALR